MNQDYMPMHRSKVLENLDHFRVNNPSITATRLMRSHLDMFLLWQVISYFQPKSFLEIGFAAGQTMGIIYESSGRNQNYTSVDIDYCRKKIFTGIFPDTKINFIETDSRMLSLPDNKIFDFIHIDGDHSYEMVVNDIDRCWHALGQTSILYMDDFRHPGVDRAIKDYILPKKDWVPFLCGDQSVFFHHQSQSKDIFLDEKIQEKSKNFVYYINEIMYDYVVLKARMPNVFVDHPHIFIETLRSYDL
jgi:predicted O-methyltransferase YrrM